MKTAIRSSALARIFLVAGFGMVASITTASAQGTPATTLRYTTGAPAKTPWVTQLERFVADVAEERSR